MDKGKALETLIELGRKEVRAYNAEREKRHRMTDIPLECVKAAARVCMLADTVKALGLMDEAAYDKAIHEAENGAVGAKPTAIGAGRGGLRPISEAIESMADAICPI
jgi:hypothetical protein